MLKNRMNLPQKVAIFIKSFDLLEFPKSSPLRFRLTNTNVSSPLRKFARGDFVNILMGVEDAPEVGRGGVVLWKMAELAQVIVVPN